MNINSHYTSQREGSYVNVAGPKMDSFSKGIQNQIANAQKQLQDLSSRKDMSPEEKMKKRQEIQKQVNDLNNQLRQHQIEQRNQKQKAKESASEDPVGRSKTTAKKNKNGRKTGLSSAGMEALISADHALGQARVQEGVATDLEGKARVLKSEIRQDAGRGGDTSAKEEALAKLENAAANATAAQIQTLGETEQKMNRAAGDETMEEQTSMEEKGHQEQDKDDPEKKSVNVLV